MKLLSRHAVMTVFTLVAAPALAGQVMAEGRGVGISGAAQFTKDESNAPEVQAIMKVRVTANSKTTLFELNNSQAARDLYAQLPLSIKVENYSDNEKIFYPPKKLNITDASQADARAGTLAYFAPWGNVVMFYDHFGSARGLYELGYAVSGREHISEMTGTIQVEKGPSQ